MGSECPQCEAVLRRSQVSSTSGEQPMFPIAPSVAKYARCEQLGVLVRSVLSPLAGQAKRH